MKLLSCCRLFREPVDAVHYLSNTCFPTLQISATFSRGLSRDLTANMSEDWDIPQTGFDADWLMNVGKLFYNTLLWS